MENQADPVVFRIFFEFSFQNPYLKRRKTDRYRHTHEVSPNESDFQGVLAIVEYKTRTHTHTHIYTHGIVGGKEGEERCSYTHNKHIRICCGSAKAERAASSAAGCASRAVERVMCAHRKVSSLALAVADFRLE